MASSSFLRGYDFESLSKQSRKRLQNLRKYGLPSAEEYQRINEAMTARENALQLQQLQQYAPQLSTLGSQLASQEQQAGLRNDLSAILGPGQELAGSALALDRLVNPEFYGFREQAFGGLERLLAAQDPAKLSGAELAETERGLNRMNTARGNFNVADATTTAASAGAFGNKLAEKQQRFGQALSLIPSLSASSRSPIDAFGVATGRGNQPQQVGAQNVVTGSQAGQLQGQNIAQLQSDYLQGQSARKTGSDVIEGGVGACMSCYIFRAYYGTDVPEHLRWVRDFVYQRNPAIEIGYKRMAKWLVPLIHRSSVVRAAVAYGMILPLSAHAGYLTGYNKWGRILAPFKWFWLRVWAFNTN